MLPSADPDAGTALTKGAHRRCKCTNTSRLISAMEQGDARNTPYVAAFNDMGRSSGRLQIIFPSRCRMR